MLSSLAGWLHEKIPRQFSTALHWRRWPAAFGVIRRFRKCRISRARRLVPWLLIRIRLCAYQRRICFAALAPRRWVCWPLADPEVNCAFATMLSCNFRGP